MNYHQTLQAMDQLRARGYKVKISHLRLSKDVEINEALSNLLATNGYVEESRRLPTIYAHQLKSRLTLKELGQEPEHIGGVTRVTIVSPDGRSFTGEAEVSRRDHYNKKLGIQIGFGRALVTAGLTVEETQTLSA